MVSSTPCCTNSLAPEVLGLAVRAPPAWPWRAVLQHVLALVLWTALALGLSGTGGVHAEGAGTASEVHLERGDEGLYLSAQLHFELPALVQDALYKGIPMYFVLQAQVARERWYWTDRQVAQAERYLRLSYQPLTRRWRLNMSPEPLERSGLGVVLGQNFDALGDALEALQRVAHWRLAGPDSVTPGATYNVQLAFRLDTSQLARPFQIGALGSDGWSLALEHSAAVVVETRP